jgi:hypothetical protein
LNVSKLTLSGLLMSLQVFELAYYVYHELYNNAVMYPVNRYTPISKILTFVSTILDILIQVTSDLLLHFLFFRRPSRYFWTSTTRFTGSVPRALFSFSGSSSPFATFQTSEQLSGIPKDM